MSSPRVVLLSIVIAIWLMADTAGAAARRLPGVRTSVTGGSTTFYLNLGPRARYTPSWVDARTYALDITGASSLLRPENRMVRSPLVSAYRVFGYDGGDGRPHIRVELSLKNEAKVDAEQKRGIVTVHVRSEATSQSNARTASVAAPGAGLQQQPASAEPGNDQHSAPASPAQVSKLSAIRAESPVSKRATAIREVQVAKLEGTPALEVQILGNGTLEYRTLRLTNPERVVVDIPNAMNRIRQKQLSVNTGPLRAVRIGQLSQRPLVTRVVMDLDAKTAYEVRRQASSLVVTLGKSGVDNAVDPKKSFPAGSPELAPEKLTGAKPGEIAERPKPGSEALQESKEEKISEIPVPLEASDLSSGPMMAKALPEVTEPAASPVPLAMAMTEPAMTEPMIAPLEPATPAETDVQAGPVMSNAEADNATVAMASVRKVQEPAAASANLATDVAPNAPPPAPMESVEKVAPPMPAAVPASPAPEPPVMASLAASAEPVAEAAMEPAIARETQPSPAWRISDSSLAPLSMNAKRTEVTASPVTVPPTPNSFSQKEARTELLAKPVAASRQPPAPMLLAQQTPPSARPAAGGAPPAARSAYSGEPISVNLKDVDLKDFFRLIHEISGLNVVLDPTVSGQVTIVLDEVPWDQAMDVVMRNNGLGKEVEGNVVRIAKLETLNTEQETRRKLNESVQKAAPMVTVPRTLSYAKANDLITTLKKFLSERGDMVADNRTNTLLITDTPERITQVETLIKTLDQKSLQVEIEARVVSASRSFARDIGSQLAASGLTGNVILGGTGAVGESPIKRGVTPPLFIGTPPTGGTFANIAQPLLTNFPAAGATSGFSFLLTKGSSFALDAIIGAAESRGIGKLLSRPKIITQNNVEAIVKQGVKIPIQTTINNTVSVQYIDVVLRLTVTPQITAEGTIFLKTDIENTSIDPGIATTPGQFGLDTQSAQTQVLVSNGGTVFFGGVVQNINRVSEAEVPLLGSVPLIGNMFKHKSTTSTTNELLFFITPRIVQS